jgi:hypothetical protein
MRVVDDKRDGRDADDEAAEARRRRRKRAETAWSKRDEWQAVMQDCYDFVAPHRLSTRWAKKSPGGYTLRIFDNTAIVALQRAAGKLVQDLFPPGEAWATLEPGPGAAAYGLDADAARDELHAQNRVVDAAFMDGQFDTAIHEATWDAHLSTGLILVLDGDAHCPVNFVSVSFDEVALDSGPFNEIHGIFWKRKWSIRALARAYPHGIFSEGFKDKLDKNGEDEITVHFDCVYDPSALAGANRGPWRFTVWAEGEETSDVFEDFSFECPWIVERLFKLPGQPYGLGPAIINMPSTKTLNKAIELTLKGAAMAIMGIFTRIDDGVFDPENALMEPGAMWPVARNGGPLGPSLQRLPTATDPNLANITIQDLRAQIQAGFNDHSLPPDLGQPRSAAEVIQRAQNMGRDDAGFYGRLVHEVAIPLRRRVMEVLWRKGILKTRLRIDQLLVKLNMVSPMAAAYRARGATTYAMGVQALNALEPGLAHIVTPLDEGGAKMLEDMGVRAAGYPIYTKEQRLAAQQKMAQAAALAAQAQQQAGAQPPPVNGDPAQAAA